ncbi:MAG: response regulator, partial [Acidobacteria bacterium]|nr:response regulator [Acidobacteriota bacterium]
MPENILVVEYEPRYTDRVKQALSGQPFSPSFARDGEEAMRALDGQQLPKLIVLSSVVPKVSTAELIRAIRGRNALAQTPILLTVSGYNGKSPKQDAQRMGASDILPKPYSESEFLGKVQQMLGVMAPAPAPATWVAAAEGQLTSDEIFGDLLQDDRTAVPGVKKPMAKGSKDDLDKMLADTLAGVMPPPKKTVPGNTAVPSTPKPAAPPPAPAPPPAQETKPRTQAGNAGAAADFEKKLADTLSGLEKSSRRPAAPTLQQPMPASTAAPAPQPPPAAARPPQPAAPPP